MLKVAGSWAFKGLCFDPPALRRVIHSLAKLRLWSSYLQELEPCLSCDMNGLPPTSLSCPQDRLSQPTGVLTLNGHSRKPRCWEVRWQCSMDVPSGLNIRAHCQAQGTFLPPSPSCLRLFTKKTGSVQEGFGSQVSLLK